jgi:hypothetical protein
MRISLLKPTVLILIAFIWTVSARAQQKTLLIKLSDPDHHSALDSLERGLSFKKIRQNGIPTARLKGKLKVERVFRPAGKNEAKHKKYGLHQWYKVSYEASFADSSKIVSTLSREVTIFESPRTQAQSVTFPEDSLFRLQWNFRNTGQTQGRPGADISLINAQRIEKGKPGVIISIHDSGIDSLHKDLIKNLWTNTNEIAGNGIDDDDNGFVDDIHGWNFASDNNILQDTDGHGTHIAGVIGDKANRTGVTGIAGGDSDENGVRLMICRLDDELPGLRILNPEESIVYAADNGSVISQNSWNTFGFSGSVRDAIWYFRDEAKNSLINGGVVIFAAGNMGQIEQRYESKESNVMMVGNTDHNDILSTRSNYGSWLALCAPGTDIFSNYVHGIWKRLSGTSMAAPHVSGVAGLVLSKFGHPNYSPDSLIQKIKAAADPIDQLNTPSHYGRLGAGRLNAFRAVIKDDHIAPQRIDSIHVINVRSQDVSLQWLAPFDSVFSAFRYQVKYWNESMMDSVVFAIEFPDAGDTVNFRVEKLQPSTQYSIQVTSFDYFGNKSSASPVIHVKTEDRPQLLINSYQSIHRFQCDSTYLSSLTIANTGASELDWQILTRHPDSLSMSSVQMKVINYWTYYEVHSFAREQGCKVFELSNEAKPFDLIGTNVLILDQQANRMNTSQYTMIRDWVLRGGNLVMMYDATAPDLTVNGLASLFGVRFARYDALHSDAVEPGGSHVMLDKILKLSFNSFQAYLVPDQQDFPHGIFPLVFDSEHNPHIIAGTFGKGKVIFAGSRFLQSYGISNDDNFLFGKNVIRWLTQDPQLQSAPQFGTVFSGENQNIVLSFNHDLGSNYSGTFYLKSNDPDHTLSALDYVLQIAGNPEINTQDSLSYDTTFIGYPLSKKLKITNSGIDTLKAKFETASSSFISMAESISILPGMSDSIQITFIPHHDGMQSAKLFIRHSDVLVDSVLLTGIGKLPSHLAVLPDDTLYINTDEKGFARKNLYIHNLEGSTNLNYTTSIKRAEPQKQGLEQFTFDHKRIGIHTYHLYGSNLEKLDWQTSTIHPLGGSIKFSELNIDTMDLLVLDQTLYNFTLADIDTIRTWVKKGGNLLVQIDQVFDSGKLNALLSGTDFRSTIHYPLTNSDTLFATLLHPVTDGVPEIYPEYFQTHLKIANSLKEILQDKYENTFMAWDTLGTGRILLAADVIVDLNLDNDHHKNFLTQAFNWLLTRDPYWLAIYPSRKQELKPGEVANLEITINEPAKRERTASIFFKTNDPGHLQKTVVIKVSATSQAQSPNDIPMQFTPDTIVVKENLPQGAVIAQLKGFDKNGDMVNWFSTEPVMAISKNGVISIADSAKIDFEKNTSLQITFNITDGIDTVSKSGTISIINVNEAPNVTIPDTVVFNEDGTYALPLIFMDPEGDNLSLRFSASPNSVFTQKQILLDKATLFFMPDANANGNTIVTIFASDNEFVDSAMCLIRVLPVNDAPELNEFPDVEIFNGDSLVLEFTVFDPDNNELQISVDAENELILSDHEFSTAKTAIDESFLNTFRVKRNGTTDVRVTAFDGALKTEKMFNLKVSSITGNSVVIESIFKVFPNPASGSVNVSSNTGASTISSLAILDVRCSEIRSTYFSETVSQATIAVSDLPSGMYFLKIKTVDKSILIYKINIE